MMYCCQKTTQYPVKIRRKSMNLGFVTTVMKFRPTSARLAACPSPERRGSLKNSSTAKNIKKTLSAETRKTFSTPTCRCAHEATTGPAVPPTLPAQDDDT